MQQYYSDTYSPPQQHPQIPVSQDEMYATLIQEDRVRNVIEQINPDKQLFEIELRIRGYKKNTMTGQWERIDPQSPEPHPTLVSRIVSYMSSLLNQSTPIGNLSDIQINRIMKLVIEYITDDLDTNAETYGIGYKKKLRVITSVGNVHEVEVFYHDYNERTRIGHIVCNSVFLVLTRALNGQEAKRMWSSLSMSESLGQEKKQASSLREALKFWK
jgi:hypothetical protein